MKKIPSIDDEFDQLNQDLKAVTDRYPKENRTPEQNNAMQHDYQLVIDAFNHRIDVDYQALLEKTHQNFLKRMDEVSKHML